MKKIFLSIMMLLSITVTMAQDDNDNQRPQKITPESSTEQMATTLSLSDSQKAAVLKLNTEYADLFKGPGNDGRRPPKKDSSTESSSSETEQDRPEMTDEMKAKMEERRTKETEYESKLKEILSDSQFSTYKKSKQKRGGHGPRKQESNN